MNKLITILLLFLSTSIFSQSEATYNKVDTTYLFQYYHLVSVMKKIENLKFDKEVANQKIEYYKKIDTLQSNVIVNLTYKDSISDVIIEQYRIMDSIQMEKLNRFNDITDNYKILLLSSQEELKAKDKQARREKLWKNIYKYGYPVALMVGGYLLLK